jgi:DivIVA domain-containing protein
LFVTPFHHAARSLPCVVTATQQFFDRATGRGAEGKTFVALSPDDIERRIFAVAPEGYDVDEVRSFLFEVAAAVRLALFSTRPLVAPPVALSHKVDAARWPERPRPDAPGRVDPAVRAERDAQEVLRKANADAASIHDQAKRVLTTAQDQADAIIADAEHTAREIVASAAGHADEHIKASTDRARRHAEEVLRAERDTLGRLRAAQADVGLAIERIARSDTRPIVDLRREVGDLRFGIPAPPSTAAAPASAPTAGHAPDALGRVDPAARPERGREPALTRHLIETGDPRDVAAGDPTLVLMRNAVTRAILAAADARPSGAPTRTDVVARSDGSLSRPER